MDAKDNRGYASGRQRSSEVSVRVPFRLGATYTKQNAVAGGIVDELYIWHELMNSHQIWQFYIQGGAFDQYTSHVG